MYVGWRERVSEFDKIILSTKYSICHILLKYMFRSMGTDIKYFNVHNKCDNKTTLNRNYMLEKKGGET